jgi:hypothetical protein
LVPCTHGAGARRHAAGAGRAPRIAKHSGKCLNVAGGAKADKAKIVSGYADAPGLDAALRRGARLVAKPASRETLLQAVREALDRQGGSLGQGT